MANPGESVDLTPNADQGTGLPDTMPRDLAADTLDQRRQPSTAEGAFGAGAASDYGTRADSGNEQATGGRFGDLPTGRGAASAGRSPEGQRTNTGQGNREKDSTGAGLGERGGAGWAGSGGGASPSVGALSGSNVHGVGASDPTSGTAASNATDRDTDSEGYNTGTSGGTLGTFGGTDRAGDTATEALSGPTAPEPEDATLPPESQGTRRSSQVDAADQHEYGGDLSKIAPEEHEDLPRGMTGDKRLTGETHQGGI